jgi:hypothetical protein
MFHSTRVNVISFRRLFSRQPGVQNSVVCRHLYQILPTSKKERGAIRIGIYLHIWVKGKAVPLQAWSGPECSRKLRFPDFLTTAQDDGNIVSLTHRPHLPPGITPGTHTHLSKGKLNLPNNTWTEGKITHTHTHVCVTIESNLKCVALGCIFFTEAERWLGVWDFKILYDLILARRDLGFFYLV